MGVRIGPARGLLACCMLLPDLLLGQARPVADARGDWFLGVGTQFDEEESESLSATLYAGVGDRTWLTLVAGRSSSPADRADIDADTLAVGIDQRFDLVGFTVELERWGDPDALESDEVAASVYFDRERWRIGFGYETRDLEIPFTVTGPLGNTLARHAEISADSVSVDARLAIGERWQLYAGAADYDYERNLALLPRIERLNWLSASTLTLANSFLDRRAYVAVDRELGRTILNVRASADRSALDASELETFEAAVLLPIGRRVDFEVNVGRGRSDAFQTGWFAGLLFLVYGR